MATPHYTVKVKENLLLGLPKAAQELNLQPGEEYEVAILKLPHHVKIGPELKPQAAEEERIARIKSIRGKYAYLGVSSDELHRERAADQESERRLLGQKP